MPPRATFRDVFAVREFRALVLRSPLRRGRSSRSGGPHPAYLLSHKSPLLTAIDVRGRSAVGDRRPVIRRRGRPAATALGDHHLRCGPRPPVAIIVVPVCPRVLVALCSRPRCSRPRLNRPGPPSHPTSCKGKHYAARHGVIQGAFLAGETMARRRGIRGRLPRRPGHARHRRVRRSWLRRCSSGSAPAPGPRPPAPRSPIVTARPDRDGFGLLFGDQRYAPCCCLAGWWSSTRSPKGWRPHWR